MKHKRNRNVLRAGGLALLSLAAVMPWAGVVAASFDKAPVKPKQRKSTDPPGMAVGKLAPDLFIAIGMRNLPEVQSLLKKGADPNSRNGLGFTPLYIAAATHQPQMMTELLAAGAQPDAPSPYGTPLTFAAISGHTAGAKMLLGKGADVNTARVDGITVLMMAAQSGNPETVGELIKQKADVNATNNQEASALTYAVRGGYAASARILLKNGAIVDQADEDKRTPLMVAAMNGNAELAKLLIEHKANVNAKDENGQTPLILAASYGDNAEVVKALLEAGAKKEVKDKQGRTAGVLASLRGFDETAGLLGTKVTAAPKRTTDQAVQSSLKLLELSMNAFNKNAACISCHQEGLGRMATAEAKDKGYPMDEGLNKTQLGKIRGALGFMKGMNEKAIADPTQMKNLPLAEIDEITPVSTWLLAGMAYQGDAATEATAAMALVLARQQRPDGMWSFALPRIPMQSTPVTFTALAIKSLKAYGPKAYAAEIEGRIAKAKEWLQKFPAKTSDELAFRVLGLKWAGATDEDLKPAVQELLAAQQVNGGWAQRSGMHSDAYATGQALYALAETGAVAITDAVYKKGVEFLLRTQDNDGSWFVNKRAMPANNYMDAAFPHGESQYSSFNGTSWALMALLQTMPKK